MAIRTEGVGAARALQFWDQYGVKKYDFSPSEMVTPGPVLFEFEKLLLGDTDVTPVGAVLLKVLDQKLKLRNAADAADVILEEGFISHTFANIVNFDGGIKAAGVESTDNIVLSGAAAVRRFQGIINLEGAETAALVITAGCYPASSKEQLLTLLGSPSQGAGINLYGEDHLYPGTIWLYTPNAAKSTTINRLKIDGAADVVDATWADTLHSGLKLKDALDANSQKLTGLGAPTDPNDAARLTDVATGGGGAYGTAGDVTVAAGAITVTGHHYKVDAAGATDLNTVTAGVGVAEGWMVVLRAKNIANPITCKDGVGNLRLQSDFTLDSLEDSIMIIYDGVNWLEVARSNNS